ncbi:hypothetical protein [Metabacillus fastidiosus]
MWMDIYIGNFPASVKKRCMYSNEQKENNRRRKEEKIDEKSTNSRT